VLTSLRLVTKDDYETLEIEMKMWDLEEKYKDKLSSMSRIERLKFLKEVISTK